MCLIINMFTISTLFFLPLKCITYNTYRLTKGEIQCNTNIYKPVLAFTLRQSKRQWLAE